MKVILFIGHHKVGSTSLQQFLSQNYRHLLQAGILYPSVDTQGFSHNVASALDPDFNTTELPINVREPHNALAFKMLAEASPFTVPPYHKDLPGSYQMLIAIKSQIETLKPHTVILCGEVFSNFAAANPALIETLYDTFKDHEITLTCTLRRPDEYVTSWHGQRLKFGQKLGSLRADGLKGYYPTIHFDYKRMLADWITTFKGANLVLRDYRDVLASGGSVEDFITHSGVDFPADLIRSANSNPSIPHALMEVARQGNHALSERDAHELRDYLIHCSKRVRMAPNHRVEIFGAENRSMLVERFSPIHDWLGQVSGKDPFFADIKGAARLRPLPEYKANRRVLPRLKRDAARHLKNASALAFIRGLTLAE